MTIICRTFPPVFSQCLWIAAATLWIASSAAAGSGIVGIHILDSIAVPPSNNGVKIAELSGLAWDEDEQLLYAVSDKGYLHHFRLELDGDKIAALTPVFSTGILGGSTGAARTNFKNAEGLDVLGAANGRRGDSELLVAFEDGPAVERFSTDGRRLGGIELPSPLADKNQYTADNNRIEALSMGPNQELLIAPEKPLLNGTGTAHEIYSAGGTTWSYPRKKGSSIKAIEFLPGGDLLVLQREKAAEGGKFVSLLVIDLDACDASAHCDAVDLPVLSGRLPAANFEGLARIDANRFVMVADAKRHDPGPALLLLFRTESAARTRTGN
jgi:Esterase-like activity of phytase